MSAPVRIGSASNVAAPPATVPSSGLVSLARTPDTSDTRWQLGYSYRPELPSVLRNRSTVTATLGADIGAGDTVGIVDVVPVLLTVEDRHSGFVHRAEDYRGRASRMLDSCTSMLLERELWTGEIAEGDDLPNPRLSSAETVTGTFGTPAAAVAALVAELAANGITDVMIHAPMDLAILMPDSWRNDRTRDDYGFVVVAGAGYPGTGPTGSGTGWLYATETVSVRLGPIEVLPDSYAEAFDTRDNTTIHYAQRVGAADFAGPAFACQVTAATP